MNEPDGPSRDRTLLRVGAFFALLLAAGAVADLLRGRGGSAWLFGNRTQAADTEARNPEADPADFVVREVLLFDGVEFREGVDVLVREGGIVDVGVGLDASGAAEVPGAGRTLLPGLIDAHTHTWGDALRSAVTMGVTTVLDMFTEPGFAAQMRAQQAAGEAAARADLFSAGVLVTAPGGHGTEYGIEIPTLERAEDADAFVRDRLEEGSDFIKIVVDDGFPGREFGSLDLETVRAVIEAAHARDLLAVVHVSKQADARAVVEAGADGIVHVWYDGAASEETIESFREHGAFVVPTLAVIESVAGGHGGEQMLADERVAPFVMPVDRASLEANFGSGDRSEILDRAVESVRRLHAAGVPILAGTDAPNPGTAHGVSLHRELELLQRAGLSSGEALAAATSVPASIFGLQDRGRIAPGARADLVLISGDPRDELTSSRAIDVVWKAGERFDRAAVRRAVAAAGTAPEVGDGTISDFDDGQVVSLLGSGWQVSTDAMAGGTSTAEMAVVTGGAAGTSHGLRVVGELTAGTAFPWAGPMLTPGAQPFAPVDLSSWAGFSFWLRSEAPMAVMVFSAASGQIPIVVEVSGGPDWARHELDFDEFTGVDPASLQAILFSPSQPGEFEFHLDEVALRR